MPRITTLSPLVQAEEEIVVTDAMIDAAINSDAPPVPSVDFTDLMDQVQSAPEVHFAKARDLVVDGKTVAPRSTIIGDVEAVKAAAPRGARAA